MVGSKKKCRICSNEKVERYAVNGKNEMYLCSIHKGHLFSEICVDNKPEAGLKRFLKVYNIVLL